MRRRTIYFFFTLFILCLLLYLSTQYVNVDNAEFIKKYITRTETPVIVPGIVVHAKKRLVNIKKNCSQSYRPNKISVLWSNTWQRLGNDSNLFLYSMYVDERLDDINYLRVIAMSNGLFSEDIFCKLWFQKLSLVVAVDLQELWVKNWDLAKPDEYFRPLLLSCPFPKSSTPTAASIISQPCGQPRNIFSFTKNQLKTSSKKDFAVCVKPLDFGKDMTHRLLEWLELQFILGADEITVYKYHLPPKTLQALTNYQNAGKVTIKEHTLPGESPKELSRSKVWQKRRHEMVVYNDCFYRHIGTHRYVVNLDLDEAIIPLLDKDWKSLLEHMKARNPKILQSAAISARNVYFFDSFGVEPDDSVPEFFHMLRHLYRSANFTPPGFAQKSFCSTNNTLSVTNHYALKTLYPHVRISSAGGTDLVQMHHYRRSCPPMMEEECENNYMKFLQKDKAILKFKDKLILNVSCKLKELNMTELSTT